MKIRTATLLVALLSLAASTGALSQNSQGQNNNSQGAVGAPEISPAEAMGALALLGGAIAIVRGYRRKQK